jgi:adenine-specific DNA methylase
MLKRLIEVALPLKEVSEQSAKEKSIRHGHISTLHIWWARRPLAACRAAVFASLIPDPDSPECPESFRTFVMHHLGRSEFRPKNEANGKPLEDTPRNRCLEFIKHLVKWENSNKAEYIEPARTLIAAAHKLLHPHAEGDAPKVLDPFAGGGAIPLEALRLGCEAQAVDINPVAHLIELCTLVFPQKYGQPNSRPVPAYIKQLNTRHRAKKGTEGSSLFDTSDDAAVAASGTMTPEVEITEAEYRKNPLAADVKYWGQWVLEATRQIIGRFYPTEPDGSIPVAFLWARTVSCTAPSCRATIPLIRQFWLCKKKGRNIALKVILDQDAKRCRFAVVENKAIDFDPEAGIVRDGKALCPFCEHVVDGEYLRSESKAGRMGEQLTAVVTVKKKTVGKRYRPATSQDEHLFGEARSFLNSRLAADPKLVPDETLPHDRPSPNSRGLSAVVRYGLDSFGKLFNARQLLALSTFASIAKRAVDCVEEVHDKDYAAAVGAFLSLGVSRLADFNSSLCVFNNVGGRGVKNTFARQALPMVWDYAESAPFNEQGANWQACIDAATKTIRNAAMSEAVSVQRGSATKLAMADNALDAVITDPPYYDSVPYSDLSDFFYVWLKRSVTGSLADAFRTPLTPKQNELIAYYGPGKRSIQKLPEWYEQRMAEAFREAQRVLDPNGISCVMFAHKTTAAWESIIGALIHSGLVVTGSWPIRTERAARMVAQNAASLASSVTLICRKRTLNAGVGLWDDVQSALKSEIKERLDFFWSQSIRGPTFSSRPLALLFLSSAGTSGSRSYRVRRSRSDSFSMRCVAS